MSKLNKALLPIVGDDKNISLERSLPKKEGDGGGRDSHEFHPVPRNQSGKFRFFKVVPPLQRSGGSNCHNISSIYPVGKGQH